MPACPTHLNPLHAGGAPDDNVIVLVAGRKELMQVRPCQLLRSLRCRALPACALGTIIVMCSTIAHEAAALACT